MSPVTIFVYGSLRRDASGAAHPLLRRARFVAAAGVRGTLYRVDWYPGLVPDEACETLVHGELFELPDTLVDSMIKAMDDYEGGGFRRRRAPVHALRESAPQLSETLPATTWVYAYTGATHALERIESGDYGTPVHRARP